MGVLKSSLTATLHDRVAGPARGIVGWLGRLKRAGDGYSRQNRQMAAPLTNTTRNLVAMGAAYLGVREGLDGTLGRAMRFETAMADVAKKTTLTERQLGETQKKILQLSNMKGGKAATEIAKLYAQAGQFGIANRELDRFVRLGSKASISFDMTAEETANSLSQLKNAFGLSMAGMESLADAINYTSDNAGTSERKLIDFLLRTSAAAKTYGVSGQEMAAFGATLNEIGIESSKAGTGMNAMMAKLSALTSKKKVVKTLDQLGGKGYSARLQKQFFEKPVDAMWEFFQVVQKMDVQKRSGLLIDFFGLEYQDDAAAIANNIDKIVGRLETLKDTSSFAGSVDKTFEIFANTSEEKLKRLKRIFQNAGAYLGAELLPPIVDFSEKLSDTLTSLDSRVTVFDTLTAKAKGFMTGLGFSAENGLGDAFSQLWDAIFGRADQLAQDTETMGAAFEKFRQMGADVRSFVDDLSATSAAMEAFMGLDHGQLGSTIGSLAEWGLLLGAGAVGFSLVASPLKALGRAVLYVSGITPAWGMLRFLGRLSKLGAKATGITALAKSVRTLGKATDKLPKDPLPGQVKNPHGFKAVTSKSHSFGNFSPKAIGEMQKRLAPAPTKAPIVPKGFWRGLGKGGLAGLIEWGGRQAMTAGFDKLDEVVGLDPKRGKVDASTGAILGRLYDDLFGSGDEAGPEKPVLSVPGTSGSDARPVASQNADVIGELEKRLPPSGAWEFLKKQPGPQDVRIVNQQRPNVNAPITITVHEAANGQQLGMEAGQALQAEIDGLMADTGYSGN